MEALVVDDSKMMRFVLGKALKEVGFTVVHEAGHGKEALAVLARIPCPGLALVDWNMPEMNGLEFVKAVRSDLAYRSMRILMVTTEGSTDHRADAEAAGADGYQSKPFTADAIRASLAALGLRV